MSPHSPTVTAVADTDVISLVFKHDTRAVMYRPHLAGQKIAVSFMTMAELKRWASQRNWGSHRCQQLDRFVSNFVTVHSDPDLCAWWATVMVSARDAGRRIEVADAWIAATALMFNVPLITHNPSDYAGVPDLVVRTEAR